MKKIELKILLGVLIFLFTTPIVLNADNTTKPERNEHTSLLIASKFSKRPNAPSRVFIECRYDEETMMFIMPDGIEYAEISISQNDEVIMTDVITRDMCILPSPSHAAGEYLVSCTSSDGRVFQGYLYF